MLATVPRALPWAENSQPFGLKRDPKQRGFDKALYRFNTRPMPEVVNQKPRPHNGVTEGSQGWSEPHWNYFERSKVIDLGSDHWLKRP